MQKCNVFSMILLFCTLTLTAESGVIPWGAHAASLADNPGIEEMLRYAIEDEYLARAEYVAIMQKFGTQRPFSNIMKAEETHIGWLNDMYNKLQLSIPKDNAAEYIVVPASLDEAFAAGAQAEIDNIAMYDSFIDSALIKKSENKSLKDLFIRLRDASKNHLEAFRKGLK